MKKALFFLLMMLVLAAAQAVSGQEYYATVKGGALHLREQAHKDAPSLGRYNSKTRVQVLYDGEEFCKVKTPDGKEGYMMKEYLDFENGLPPKEVATPSPAPTPDPTRQNALLRGIDPNKPMLALTFDDGPQPGSERVLDALKANGARATFFVLGKNIEGNEATLKRMVDEGHQVGAHSWSHPNFREVSESVVRSQMTRTMDKVEELTGYKVTMMRPPYGALNRLSRRQMTDLGLPVILWSLDSLDWQHKSTSKTISTIKSKAENGAIVLCHDVWDTTGAAMETLIPDLIAQGYQLVTVAEMMSFRNAPLNAGTEYSFLDIAKIEPGLTPVPLNTPSPAADNQ